jgi:hypothetical protein
MTRTVRGKEIDMATLVAANDETLAVSNINTNARGDILGPGGRIEVPAQEVQQEYYKEKVTAPAETINTIDELQAKVKGPKKTDLRTTVVEEREFDRDGKTWIETEFADGSIKEKEINENKATTK